MYKGLLQLPIFTQPSVVLVLHCPSSKLTSSNVHPFLPSLILIILFFITLFSLARLTCHINSFPRRLTTSLPASIPPPNFLFIITSLVVIRQELSPIFHFCRCAFTSILLIYHQVSYPYSILLLIMFQCVTYVCSSVLHPAG